MLAVAEMYVKGVSTRDAARVMAEFGLEGLSSTQVSRAAALLDDELRGLAGTRALVVSTHDPDRVASLATDRLELAA
jgi:transposase-like protein